MIFPYYDPGKSRRHVPRYGNEFFFRRIEAVEGIVVCLDPQITAGILVNGKYPVVRKIRIVAGLRGVVHEGISVEPVEPVPGGNPDIPVPVLENLADIVVGKAVFRRIMFEKALDRSCRQAQCRQKKQKRKYQSDRFHESEYFEVPVFARPEDNIGSISFEILGLEFV